MKISIPPVSNPATYQRNLSLKLVNDPERHKLYENLISFGLLGMTMTGVSIALPPLNKAFDYRGCLSQRRSEGQWKRKYDKQAAASKGLKLLNAPSLKDRQNAVKEACTRQVDTPEFKKRQANSWPYQLTGAVGSFILSVTGVAGIASQHLRRR